MHFFLEVCTKYGVAMACLMVMTSDCGLGGWGSIPGWGKSLTPGFVFKKSSNRIDGCADRMNKIPDLIIKNAK